MEKTVETLINTTTLLEDIRAVGASHLKDLKYYDARSNEIYRVISGFPGRIKPLNSSFKVVYEKDNRIVKIYAKEHYDDKRVS